MAERNFIQKAADWLTDVTGVGGVGSRPDPATNETTTPSSPDQPGSDRLAEIVKNLREEEARLNNIGFLNDSGTTLRVTPKINGEATSQEEFNRRCDILQQTQLALSDSPVLESGAKIEVSSALRSCLYARTSEFNNKDCRTAFRNVQNAVNRNQLTESNVGKLIEETQRSGNCPRTLGLLRGAGMGPTTPLITLKRNSNTNKVPNLNNVLNDYINVQYHVAFSMIPEKEARRLQTRIGRAESRTENETVSDLNQRVRKSGAVTLASTGEANRNSVSKVENPDEINIIERVDESFFKQGEVKEIQSGLSKLAQLWNEGGNVSDILESERFRNLAKEVSDKTVRIQEQRDAVLTGIINGLQSVDNIPESERSSVDVSDRNYYNINSLKINNVHGPTYQDPFVSNLTAMEMTIVEPHGLNLNEDLLKLSVNLGYKNINPGRILYKVDIWFSGYNPETGDWVWNIPVSDNAATGKSVVSYYVVMTGMEATFDVVGTQYNVSFAPQGFQAVRPEEFSLDGMSIPTGKNPTFGAFLKNLSEAMSKKRKDETKEALGGAGLNRIFKFYAPDAIMNAPFYQGAFLQRNNLTSEDPKDGMFVTVGKDIDILTLLRSALSDLPEVQTAFLTNKDNSRFIDPVVHFTVRFNVKYASERPEIYDYDGIVYEFIIEPFLTYKKLGFDEKTIKEYTDPNAQVERVSRMLNLGIIQRVYDYINTSENTDVFNFDIKMNRFYYESFRRSFDPGARKGKHTATTPAEVEAASNQIGSRREMTVNLELNNDPLVSKRYQAAEDSLLQKIFGDGIDRRNANTQHASSPNQVLHGGLGTTNDPVSYGATTSDGSITKTKDEYLYRFNDHFALDLINLENLDLRGDPTWLLSPYASANNNTLLSMEARGTNGEIVDRLLQPHGEKVIYLNINSVEQFDYMDPSTPGRKKADPSVIAGFYGITGSESTFEDGKFTQTLSGYKMAHLNYVGEQLVIGNLSSAASTGENDDSLRSSEWITQVLDHAQKLPQYSTAVSEYREQKRLAKRSD